MITIFVTVVCCLIFTYAVQIISSHTVATDVVKCIKYVLNNVGSSATMAIYSPDNISVVVSKKYGFNTIIVGSTIIEFPYYVHFVVYSSFQNVTVLYIPAGYHVIRCSSYIDYDIVGNNIVRYVYVVITLYR